MEKTTTILLAVLSTLILSAQDDVVIENDSIILWQKENSLTWEDFKGNGQQAGDIHTIHQVAATAPKIIFVYTRDENGVLLPTPLCYFEKYLSWSTTTEPQMLEHEQLHFDIEELYARKLRKRFRELQLQNIYENDIYNSVKNEIFDECNLAQNKYDDEVLLNYPKQQEWRKCIDKELEELKEYEYVPEE